MGEREFERQSLRDREIFLRLDARTLAGRQAGRQAEADRQVE